MKRLLLFVLILTYSSNAYSQVYEKPIENKTEVMVHVRLSVSGRNAPSFNFNPDPNWLNVTIETIPSNNYVYKNIYTSRAYSISDNFGYFTADMRRDLPVLLRQNKKGGIKVYRKVIGHNIFLLSLFSLPQLRFPYLNIQNFNLKHDSQKARNYVIKDKKIMYVVCNRMDTSYVRRWQYKFEGGEWTDCVLGSIPDTLFFSTNNLIERDRQNSFGKTCLLRYVTKDFDYLSGGGREQVLHYVGRASDSVQIDFKKWEVKIDNYAATLDYSCLAKKYVYKIPTGADYKEYLYTTSGDLVQQLVNNNEIALIGNYSIYRYSTYADEEQQTPEIKPITFYPALSLSVPETTSSYSECPTGTVTIKARGGKGVKRYSKDGINYVSDSVFTQIAAGRRTFYVKDERECVEQQVVAIAGYPSFSVTGTNITNASCNGGTGSVTLTCTGGDGTTLYATVDRRRQPVSNGKVTFSNLNPGTYSVTLGNSGTCTKTFTNSFTITAPAPISVVPTINLPGCYGGNSTVDVAVTGGNGGYSYSWNGGSAVRFTGNRFTYGPALFAGGRSYTVTVTDSKGCTGSATVTGRDPDPLQLTFSTSDQYKTDAATGTVTIQSCSSANGSVSVSFGASGGKNSYRLTRNGAAVSLNTALSLAPSATDYTFTLTDAGGCSKSMRVKVLSRLTANIITGNIIHPCGSNTGEIPVQVTGGSGAYTFSPVSTSVSGSTYKIGNLSAGVKTITLSDGYCTLTRNATLNSPLSFTATSTMDCTKDKSDIVVSNLRGGSGAYTYALKNSAGTTVGTTVTNSRFANLNSGRYTVAVTSATCTQTADVNVYNRPRFENFSINTPLCPQTNNVAGVSFTIAEGTTSKVLKMVYPAGSLPEEKDPNRLSDITLNANGVVLFRIEDGTCRIENSGNVNLPVLNVSLSSGTWSCSTTGRGELTATVNVSNHYSTYRVTLYRVVSGSEVEVESRTSATGTSAYRFSVATGGDYRVKVTSGTCTAQSSTISYHPNSKLSIASVDVTDPVCFGNSGKVAITVNDLDAGRTLVGNGSYSAIGNVLTYNASAGTSTYRVSDGYCDLTSQNVTVTNPVMPTFDYDITHPSCNGDDALVTFKDVAPVGETYTYEINGVSYATPGITLSSPVNGLALALKVRNSKGCYSNVVNATVATPQPLVGRFDATPVSCAGGQNGAISLAASGGTQPYRYYKVDGVTETAIPGSTLSGVAAGDYTVKVVDSKGCSYTQRLAVSQPETLSFSATPAPPTCRDGNDGTIALQISGGNTGAYTYSLNGGSSVNLSDAIIRGLSSGIYQVHLTDSKGCTAVQADVNVTNPQEWIWDIETLNPTCSDNGEVKIRSLTGGYGDYVFTSNNSSISYPFTGLGDGKQTIEVADRRDCRQSKEVELVKDALKVTYTTRNITCFGGDDGKIDVTVSGGRINGSYSVSLSKAGSAVLGTGNQENSSISYTGLTAGTFSLQVSDNSGCSYSAEIVLTQHPVPVAFDEVITDALTCHELGKIEFTNPRGFQGGMDELVYKVGATEQVGNPSFTLNTGRYSIRITDSKGCFTEKQVVVTPEVLTATLVDTQIDCSGNSNGAIEIKQLSGGIGQLSVICLPITAPAPADGDYTSTMYYSNLAPGTYQVYGRDENNRCKMSIGQVTIKEVLPLEVAYNVDMPTCNGLTDGSAVVHVKGGNGSYSLTVDGNPVTVTESNGVPGGTATVSGLAAGQHIITLTDKNSCPNRGTDRIEVSEPTPVAAVVDRFDDVDCNSNANGRILLNATGGNGMYTIVTSKNGASFKRDERINSSYSLDRLSPGSYSFAVTDGKGCTTPVALPAVTISEPAPLSLAVDAFKDLTCYQNGSGEVTLRAEGGNTQRYTYSLMNGTPQDSPTFGNLAAGAYTFEVIDSKGCRAGVSRDVAQPALLELTGIDMVAPLCFGYKGSITPTLAGGTPPYMVRVDGVSGFAAPVKTELAKGEYTLRYKDVNGCEFTRAVSMTEPDTLKVTGVIDQPLCFEYEGKLRIVANGGTPGYTYSLNGSGYTHADEYTVKRGAYTASVTDRNGCRTDIKVDVTEPKPLTLAQSFTAPLCNGLTGTATLNGSGGTSPYIYTVGYDNGFPGSGNVAAGGGQSITITGLRGGLSYLPAIKDNNGCTTVGSTIAMPEPSLLSWSKEDVADLKCFNDATGRVMVGATGGTLPYSYFLGSQSSPSGVFEKLNSGTYNAKVTDANGCLLQKGITLKEPALLRDNAIVNPQRCFTLCDGTISLQPTGGTAPYSIKWNKPEYDGSAMLRKLCGGSYLLNLTDAHGCAVAKDLSFATPQQILLDVGFSDTTLCKGTSVLVTPQPGKYGLLWMRNGSFLANGSNYNVTASGDYTVKAMDAAGCSVDFGFKVTVLDQEQLSDFLLSSKAAANDTLVFVDLSNPKPTKVEWKYGPEARLVEEQPGYIKLVYAQPGVYTVGLKSFGAGCATAVEKRVEIGPREDRFEIEKSLGYKESILKSFKAYPNPNTGIFKVSVILNKRADVTVRLFAINSSSPKYVNTLTGDSKYELEFSRADLVQGFYILNIMVEGESHSLKIVKM